MDESAHNARHRPLDSLKALPRDDAGLTITLVAVEVPTVVGHVSLTASGNLVPVIVQSRVDLPPQIAGQFLFVFH
jgi:hypothetical protein